MCLARLRRLYFNSGISYCCCSLVLALAVAFPAFTQTNVVNVDYDNQQTGANLRETILSPRTDWDTFGKAGSFPVDGQVYAQPLYVTGVAIGGTKYNVVYVATMHDSVYAFNADTPQVATPLWKVNLGMSVPSGVFNFTDILPEVGILGTPVIDPVNQVLYVVSDIVRPPAAPNNPVFQLHALSLVDGHEMDGGPVDIAATVAGTGTGSANGILAFDAYQQLQRPGLMLANGTLYIGFGSHADAGSYHGWVLGYDASTLRQTSVFNSSKNGGGSAFWQSGRGPAIDDNGDIYVVTGNGDFDGASNFGETILRLSGTDLSLLDWYTPQEWSSFNDQDLDLGSVGAILIPGTNLLLTGGKSGMLYVVQDTSMGHLGADVTSTVQSSQVNSWGLFTMALWNNAPTGPTVYEFEPGDSLKAFQIVNNQINSTILSQYTPPYYSMYAGISLSANGTQNGIVWLVTGNSTIDGVPATLHALDATNLAHELWNSDTNAGRDTPGALTKFGTPLVANGRVYVPTISDAVAIYGTLSQATPTPAISAVVNSASNLSGAIAPGELITILGANLGPPSESSGIVDGAFLTSTVDDTEVMIGGVPAPLLYVSSNQINAIVPFGIAGLTEDVQVLYQGQVTATTTVPVQTDSPAIFSMNSSGGGQGAILNQDGSVNSASNPAAPGSVVVLFANGAGQTTPSSEDGLVSTPPYAIPNLPVTVTIDGQPAQVIYAGYAFGLVAGVLQINVVVPSAAVSSNSAQVVMTVGGTSGPSAVTMAVQ